MPQENRTVLMSKILDLVHGRNQFIVGVNHVLINTDLCLNDLEQPTMKF